MGLSLKNYEIIEEKIIIDGMPIIRFVPKAMKKPYKTLIFYHGWGSSKYSQRIRAFLISTLGYQVILPDGIHHGERDPLEDYNNPKYVFDYFWETIFKNLEEAPRLISYIMSNLDGDINNIHVTGHSMGGFTAGGVFTHNHSVRSVVTLNGSLNWMESNQYFLKDMAQLKDIDTGGENYKLVEGKIRDLDPINNLEKLKNRPIKIIHGEKDSQVSIKPQIDFYKEIEPTYENKKDISFMKVEDLDHFVTTNMIEELILWLNRF